MTKEQTNTLLSLIQKEFPIVKKPFLEIANKLGVSEDKVLAELKKLKQNSVIRQISPIYDTKKMGYESSLVAFVVDEKNIDKAVEILNSHPGISHNYERNHRFNIWFTIAVPPDSSLGLEKSVELLAKLSDAKEFNILPTIKTFKIHVKLDTSGKASKKEEVKKKTLVSYELKDEDYPIIEKSQYDLELVSEPFRKIVDELDITYDGFFEKLQTFKDAGIMRRFSAILNHRKAGFSANAMVAWDVDENLADEMGKKAASFSAVSHCYLRPKYPNWKYNLFTMVHGKTTDETNSIIDEIASEILYHDRISLYSTREFKKQRVIYWTNDIYKWEKKYIY